MLQMSEFCSGLTNLCMHAQVLGAKEGFFVKLVDSVVANFGGFYPELIAKRDHITDVIRCVRIHPSLVTVWGSIK